MTRDSGLRLLALSGALVLASSLMACGAQPSVRVASGKSPRTHHGPPEIPPVNWDNPILGIERSSVAGAQPDLPFTMRSPKGLGQWTHLFISPPNDVNRDHRVAAFIYDSPTFGRVVVEEHFPDVPVSEYADFQQHFMAENSDPQFQGSYQLVDIGGGRQALVSIPASGTDVMILWLDGGREFIVRGPSLTTSQAEAIARSL